MAHRAASDPSPTATNTVTSRRHLGASQRLGPGPGIVPSPEGVEPPACGGRRGNGIDDVGVGHPPYPPHGVTRRGRPARRVQCRASQHHPDQACDDRHHEGQRQDPGGIGHIAARPHVVEPGTRRHVAGHAQTDRCQQKGRAPPSGCHTPGAGIVVSEHLPGQVGTAAYPSPRVRSDRSRSPRRAVRVPERSPPHATTLRPPRRPRRPPP